MLRGFRNHLSAFQTSTSALCSLVFQRRARANKQTSCNGVYFPLAHRPFPFGPRYSSYLPICRRVSTLDTRYQAF